MVDFPIRVVVNTSTAVSGIKQVDKALAALEKRAVNIKVKLNNSLDTPAPDRLRTKISLLDRGLRALILSAAKTGTTLDKTRASISGVSAQVDKLRAVSNRASTALVKTSATLKSVSSQAAKLKAVRAGLEGIGTSAERSVSKVRSLDFHMLRLENSTEKAKRQSNGLRAALSALATGIVVRSVVNIASSFEQLERRIRSVSGSAEETRSNFNLLRRISNETGSSLAANAKAFQRFSVATKTLGIGAARTAGIVKTLQQALIVGGAAASEANSAVTQLGQGLASGRLQGDELRSLLENAPTLAQELANQLGVTTGELRALGAAGKLTSEKLVAALEGASSTIGAQFEGLGNSFDQQIARLKNSLLGLGESLQPFLKRLSDGVGLLTQLTDAAKELSDTFDKGPAGTNLAIENLAQQTELRRGIQADTSLPPEIRERAGARQQAQRLGIQTGAFAGVEPGDIDALDAKITELVNRFAEVGLASNDIKILTDSFVQLGLSQGEAGIQTENFLAKLNKEAGTAVAATENLSLSFQEMAANLERVNKANETAARKAKAAVEPQIVALENQKRLIEETGAARAALAERLRAEVLLRKAGIELNTAAAQAQLKEVEALALANAQRQEAIRITEEQTVAAKRLADQQAKQAQADQARASRTAASEELRKSNELLRQRESLLSAIRTPEEERIIVQDQMNVLLAEGVLTQTEYNRLLTELPAITQVTNTQMDDFVNKLKDANKAAQDLGAAFGDTLTSAIDRSADALATFVVEGANDMDALREAMANILADIAKDILAAIIKALILKAITAAIGGSGPTVETKTQGQVLGNIPDIGTGLARHGASTGGRNYHVGEQGAELYLRPQSRMSSAASAMRASRRTTSTASRFATRQSGGTVIGTGGPGTFNPPGAGQIVSAAQTSALLNQNRADAPTVVQAPAPQVSVSVTPTIQVGGKVFKTAIRDSEEVQSEIVQVVQDNQAGIRQGGR